ncbi:DUF4235 domain-containing protein [Streptomyces sp. NPDC047928]|uniref:DUF4235 domain-containing protein n=1 Tax=unclassified Streptomyces TaxID=2593676 RepID=UPI0037145BF1
MARERSAEPQRQKKDRTKKKRKKQKLLYRPVGILLGVLSGAVATALFSRLWRMVGGGDEAPEALDEDREWREVLFAAALQGAIFAAVKAAVDRSGAAGVRRLTGTWPA